MDALPDILRHLNLVQASALFLTENIIVFLCAIILGHLLAGRFRHKPVASAPDALSRMEIVLTATTILLNTVITLLGWYLWREGIIRFRGDVGIGVVIDVLVMIMVMDLAMYILHRAAHIPGIYRILHMTHHRYDRPRPLTLFVLNPFETLSFGLLWLLVIALYDASWAGMSIYLGLNVLFGVIGHLGVEPLPAAWRDLPLLRHLSTSTFHAQHHHDREHNFGFYTLLWDRLFGTLSPQYTDEFGQLPGGSTITTSRNQENLQP